MEFLEQVERGCRVPHVNNSDSDFKLNSNFQFQFLRYDEHEIVGARGKGL